MTRQLHLNLFIQARGHHETSWDNPGATLRDHFGLDRPADGF